MTKIPKLIMPAEWEKQEAIWLSWPCNPQTWPGRLHELQRVFAKVAAHITQWEKVRIHVAPRLLKETRTLLDEEGADLTQVELYGYETNDVWCRDHGPIFVRDQETKRLAVTDWQFNAWGGKFPPWDWDNEVPCLVAERLALPRHASDMILEGGAIEVNGQGTLITTEAVLLNPNRDTGRKKPDIEAELRRLLGVEQIIWLPEGIEGDDTDGHIDDLTRFVNPTTVVTAIESNASDPNAKILNENRRLLKEARLANGSALEVIDLPMPEALRPNQKDWRLERLPASYANFLILNGAVLVPVFEQVQDDRALGILRECFPGRQVIGFDSRDLVFEGGAIHCITQQQPAR